MIPYTSNKDTSYVNIKFADRDFRDNPSNGEFRLRKDYFSKGLGRYIVNFRNHMDHKDNEEQKNKLSLM